MAPCTCPFNGADSSASRAPAQYLTTFPTPLLNVLPGLSTVPELISGASEDLRTAGIDRYSDRILRATLEQHAIDAAVEFLQACDYAVVDVSAFERHHLRAQHGDEDPIAITVIAS